MVTDDELAQFAADLESDCVERKSSLSSSAREKVGQAICAFANDLPGRERPGVVMVGVDDHGEPTGLSITDRLLQDLAAYRNPVLAEGLKVLGFVQRFGMGIALARRSCRDNGNPEPRFEFSPSALLCTLEGI
jgi:ATP-dependent DNA helicase RecG